MLSLLKHCYHRAVAICEVGSSIAPYCLRSNLILYMIYVLSINTLSHFVCEHSAVHCEPEDMPPPAQPHDFFHEAHHSKTSNYLIKASSNFKTCFPGKCVTPAALPSGHAEAGALEAVLLLIVQSAPARSLLIRCRYTCTATPTAAWAACAHVCRPSSLRACRLPSVGATMLQWNGLTETTYSRC